jgi:hypothetical protein
VEDEEFEDVAVDGGEEGEGVAEVGAAGWGVWDGWWKLVWMLQIKTQTNGKVHSPR